MDIQTFIQHFAAQFEDTDAALIQADTKFRSLDEWDSLIALSIMAMVDEEYNVKLTGDEMRKAQTPREIFDLIAAKKA
jgi:acyl carrier protein